MRRLLPDPADEVDLDAAYAVPPGRLHLRADFVGSLDGAATWRGRSKPLSGPADRIVFHTLRGHADVILAGAGTVRAEGYGPAEPTPARQQWRRDQGYAPTPPMAVVSASLDLDPNSAYFTAAVARPIVFTTASADPRRRAALADRADVIVCGELRVDVRRALDELAGRGLHRVLCEGGPTLLGELLAADRLDELCLTISPLLTGPGGRRLSEGPSLAAPVRLHLAQLLEADGMLFARYVTRTSTSTMRRS